MSDYDFWREVYNGFQMIYRGIGAIMAAIAKRHVIKVSGATSANTNITPPPTFAG